MDIDLSINLEETSTIIKDFIRAYVNNAGFKSVVIGLSGGIDSAVSAVICGETLGKENTHCIFMPTETTSDEDGRHTQLLVKNFDLKCQYIDITSTVNHVCEVCLEKPDKMTLANIKARVRMILLFAYANTKKSLVCGTGNKSELLIGYFTKYGDGGVDFLPLGELYKTQIFELAKYLNIPEELINKPPTAGLWDGQTDEKEMGMSYKNLDKILYGLEQKLDVEEISKIVNVDRFEVERIRQMRIKSQHKRSTPSIPKIWERTPSLDPRPPIQES